MDVTPSHSRVRQRLNAAQTRRRVSHSDDDYDNALDAMLVELGIPDSGSKKKKKERASPEVIEIISPPQAKKSRSDGPVVDLTTSPSSPLHVAETRITATASSQEDTVSSSDVDIVEFAFSPSGSPPPFVTVATASSLPEPESVRVRRQVFPQEERGGLETQRAGPKQARRLSGRLRDLHSETTRNGAAKQRRRREETLATRAERAVHSASPARPTSTANAAGKSRAASSSTGAAVRAVVQMERSLDASSAGESIRSALQSHIYNNKPVSYLLGAALDCRHPGVIRWERRDGTANSHFSCAIYYEAEAFLEMLQQRYYKEVLAVVRYLQTLVPQRRNKNAPSRQQTEEEEPSKFFVIVEGMDRALIQLKKQQKQKKKGPTPSSTSPMISFADLHELAFQLFMDVGAHTKFTCDLDATASYVALLTRELVVASSRPSAVEEFLESVPRYNSFRVTRAGGTASASSNAWLRMLQVIPGVSEDKAQSLLDHFPTFDSLMRAYRDPTLSRQEKEGLVSDKLHDVRIEHTLSRRIYSVFCEEDPDALIP
ncbi:hypothetical protein PHYBOEH_005426 [Phytophthora boehmeriae]|uniref:ERCC4 domain-containing protein n=1 Tax=Phytophthora boehmeriae TaxID=109152 RepID=A0A8T1WM49_9STRA|nr:hypothetical protein PHYBOEH_005426 [Phytophthora boehmeriae]